MSSRVPYLIVVALLAGCFALAAPLGTWFDTWPGNRLLPGDPLGIVLGDGKRLLADHFFVKADAYFHSGYYPSIFDQRSAFKTPHVAADTGTVEGKNEGDEHEFLGKPRDWIEDFGRKFFPSEHTHLTEGGAHGHEEEGGTLDGKVELREILPWLRLSASLDPNDIRTYTAAAYWLRDQMGKVGEAEQFLREGLQANPGSYEILFELGRVYEENKNDREHARNLWEAALKNWIKQESGKTEPDKFMLMQIASHLALVEQKLGDYQQALAHMELWKTASPHPGEVQKFIDELKTEKPGK